MEMKILIIVLIALGVIQIFQIILKIKGSNVDKRTEKELELIKKREEGFRNVMEYDYDVALGRRISGE
jgi:hypothetical protein